MSRRRRILSIGSGSDAPHGDKPWVYFMVDCFFLITQFFLIAFHAKTGATYSLERTNPPGNTNKHPVEPIHSPDEILPVHISQENGQVTMLFQNHTTDFANFSESLRRVASGRNTFKVNLSYDANVEWQKVIDVMNECSKLKIEKCSLIPLRADQAAPR